jgi:hypothetical protein
VAEIRVDLTDYYLFTFIPERSDDQYLSKLGQGNTASGTLVTRLSKLHVFSSFMTGKFTAVGGFKLALAYRERAASPSFFFCW